MKSGCYSATAFAFAVFFVGGCGCPAAVSYALRVDVRNEDGDRVVPDELVVRHDGETQTLVEGGETRGGDGEGDCNWRDGLRTFSHEKGEFTIEASCGGETFTRNVQVSGGTCGPDTREVALEVPTGACNRCPSSKPDPRDVDVPDRESTEHFEWVRYDTTPGSSSNYLDVEMAGDGGVIVAGTSGDPPGDSGMGDSTVDGVVVKYTSDGSVDWVHRATSASANFISAIEVGPEGDVFAVGESLGSSVGSAEGQWPPGTRYLIRLSAGGEVRGRTEMSVEGLTQLSALESVDGDAIVVGSGFPPDSSGGNEERDAVVTRVDPSSGEPEWVEFLGGDGEDRALSATTYGSDQTTIYVPVVHGDPEGNEFDDTVFFVSPDGEVRDRLSLDSDRVSALAYVANRDQSVLFAGRSLADGGGLDAFVAGGTAVYPTVDFTAAYDPGGGEVARDIATADGSTAWVTGRRRTHAGADVSSAFAVQYGRSDGQLRDEIVFGDATEVLVSPEAIATDGNGVYVVGQTAELFGNGLPVQPEPAFVGRLKTDSGP